MEIDIVDAERGEVVATASDERGLETDDELAQGTIPVEDDGTVGYAYAVSGGEGAMGTALMELEPGDDGYLHAVVDCLPHPFEPAGDAGGLEPPETPD